MQWKDNHSYDELIRQAGQKAGVDPQRIRQTIDAGKLDDLLSRMKPQDAERFRQIVADPELARKMLDTPQARLLIKQFLK